MSTTWTSADVTALKAAIAGGARRVSYNGPPAREIEYHSLDEMRQLLAAMIAEVDTAAGTRKPYILAAHTKGF